MALSSHLYTEQQEIVKENKSVVTEFLICGFSDIENLQPVLFLIFLQIYVLTVLGNVVIITVIMWDVHLQKPMYCFLCNMSFLDFSYSTVTTPYMLYVLITGHKNLSIKKCMTQLYFFNSFASVEYLLLTTMAYDRYMAICKPFQYTQVMDRKVCFWLSFTAWTSGFIAALPVTILSSSLTFCASNAINHFFCDVTPLLTLSCDDTSAIEMTMFTEGIVLLFSCFLLTVMSYVYIISAILKIQSTEGRHKAFSTCASHLTVVTLFYILVVCVYMKPTSSYSLDVGKMLSVLYVNVIPMLNPFIYSLRNKDVKKTLIKLYQLHKSTQLY
ncbi:olfactory receptor 5AR1-like [Dendropsophus ebraccatus]|uniref:olfactory receptor 5AR1-like n=1 Tax=Dendropsophus ebraccatus TaxID=150705 RepID=UPI0038321FBA